MISLLVALIVFGVLLYVLQLIPMDSTVRQIIRVVAILILLLWLLQAFGLWHGLPSGTLR